MAECASCGGFVTDDYVRVFGDNEGTISECRGCRAHSSPSEEDAAEDTGERVVLLRDVAGDDSNGENESESESEGTAGASDTGTTPESSDESVSSSGVAASDGTEQGTKGRESATKSGGARERLAGFFSSIRG